MKRVWICLFVFVLLVGIVSAQDGGDDSVDDEGDTGGDEISEEDKSGGYNANFWIALGLGFGAALLFLLLLFLLLRRPENKWKKQKGS